MLHENRQIQKQHLLPLIREELFQQLPEPDNRQVPLIPKVQIHQQGVLQQEQQQLFQNLNTEQLTEPIPRAIIILV